ncbi:hypothetical protein QR680_002091 [Steinernema hermaphroditum]|uniref:LRRCT domain-containing protein n=1 Tax=Steinernema hermaphroditum TaxID=289476 RepID=A0AA39H174_9BILA|nr:hypothetical protein QR680_002091 [Steinernema hermaphroditum]
MNINEIPSTGDILDECKASGEEGIRGIPLTSTGTIDFSSVPLITDKLMTDVLTKDLTYARQNIAYFAKKALDLLKERNAAQAFAEQMKAKVKLLENQNKCIRESAVRMQARVEQEEEYISNMLLKRIQKLKNDKESLALMYEQEEEYLTNDLTRKLSQLESERNELAGRLAQEQSWVESNLLEKIRRLEGEIQTHQNSLETMRKEKVDLENSLEQEQESLFNTLGKRISKLESEKRTMQNRLSQYESVEASPSESDENSDVSELVCGDNSAVNCTCTHDNEPTVICDYARFKDEGQYFSLNTACLSFPKNYEPKQVLPSVAKKLTDLDLSDNLINYIGKNAFENMDSLKVLRLSHNNLKHLRQEMFHDDLGFKLHKLFLDYNDIAELPDGVFKNLGNLHTLVLDGNVLTNFSKKSFLGLSNLQELSMDYCNIEKLPVDVFDELINLKRLSLRGNKFVKIPKAVNSITHLEILDMSKTHVAEFKDRSLKSDHQIKKLIMTNLTYMYHIDSCAFCDLKNLEEIDFSNSKQLYHIDINAFGMASQEGERASNVTKINFANCNISALPEGLYDFESLEEFRLEGNPLLCNCHTDFLASPAIRYKDTPRCALPPRLEGVEITKATHTCGFNFSDAVEAFFLLYCILLFLIGGSLFWVKGRCTNVFYKPDMPHIGYSNLTARSDDDQKQLQNDFDPVNV